MIMRPIPSTNRMWHDSLERKSSLWSTWPRPTLQRMGQALTVAHRRVSNLTHTNVARIVNPRRSSLVVVVFEALPPATPRRHPCDSRVRQHVVILPRAAQVALAPVAVKILFGTSAVRCYIQQAPGGRWRRSRRGSRIWGCGGGGGCVTSRLERGVGVCWTRAKACVSFGRVRRRERRVSSDFDSRSCCVTMWRSTGRGLRMIGLGFGLLLLYTQTVGRVCICEEGAITEPVMRSRGRSTMRPLAHCHPEPPRTSNGRVPISRRKGPIWSDLI